MIRPYHYDVAYISNVGNVRTTNQDSLLVRCGKVGEKEFALLAVADGMGGLSHGERASGAAIQNLEDWWHTRLPKLISSFAWDRVKSSMAVLIDQINWSIYSANDSTGEKSGTTLTVAFLYQDRYCISQVGDSRAYKLSSDGLFQITKDQTYVQREVDAGRMSQEEARIHPMKHVLISTLGVVPEYSMEQIEGKLEPYDGLLLCSDGFYNEMHLPWYTGFSNGLSLRDMLLNEEQAICRGEASDNLTAILARFNKGKR